MSHLTNLLVREENKLVRRQEAVAVTEKEIEIFGGTTKLINKFDRQNDAVRESKAAITKLKKAIAEENK